MCTILFDSIHYYDEEHFRKYGYPSSKKTIAQIEYELEEEQRHIDFLYEEHLAEISEEEQCHIDFLYEGYLANLKEGNKNDK